MIRYFIVFLATVFVAFAALGIANYHLDPLTFSSGHAATVVEEYFDQGQHYILRDPNFDFRGLRREHIKRLKATPEVIITGGSRVQEVSAKAVPGRTFYNAYVTLDGFADTLGVTEMLIQANRLPKTYIISIRGKQFIPIADAEGVDWKLLAPEYRALATRLGMKVPSWFESFPTEHWRNLFSVDRLMRQIELRRKSDAEPGGSTEYSGTHARIRADGSLSKSAAHRKAETPEAGDENARKGAAKDKKKRLRIDPGAVAGMGKLLDLLHQRGTQVVLLMTPMHPLYFGGIAGTQYGKDLDRVEQEVRRLAREHHALAIGGFDPKQAPCDRSDYQDWIHVTDRCVTLVLREVPGLISEASPKEASHAF